MSQHRARPHRSRAVGCALALVALLALPSAALAAPEQSDQAAAPAAAPSPTGIIVVWESGATGVQRANARDEADASFVRTLGRPAFQLVRPEPGQSVADALAALRDDPAVRLAVRDTRDELHATTNDPLFGQLWGLLNTGLGVNGFAGALPGADANVAAAWDRTRGTPSTVVADIDSGYRFDAPDLGPVAWTNPADPANGADDDGNGIVDDTHGADFAAIDDRVQATDGNPTDDDVDAGGHGVHTAGTIGAAGNNGVGISGVAQDVRIMPLRVCHPSCLSSSQILAINYAGTHGARVANMSLGGTTPSGAIQAAIAANPQMLFVISAGNGVDPVRRDGIGDDNDAIPTYPCSYPLDNIICVAALDQADQLADFSNFGLRSVDLGAPGVDVLSTFPVTTTQIDDDFEVNDFAGTWSNGGAGFGRASAGDGPLTSFGMNDSPGAAPTASTARTVTMTTGAAVPAGTGACILSGLRRIARGSGGSFFYEVLADGSSEFLNSSAANTAGSGMASFFTAPITGLGGHVVRLRFGFTGGPAPTTADGLWIDDLQLTCNAPLSTPPTYDFLDGTSMAAPHVTGAAGLLFSLKPTATVAEVKAAILGTTHPVAALAGKTVTGGRLDVAAALNALVPILPPPPPPPPPPVARTAAATCTLPRLKGLSLSRAKARLRRAHCALGVVSRPRARRGRRLPALVVKSSRPGAGARGAAGMSVALTLKAKPRPRPRRHRRRRR